MSTVFRKLLHRYVPSHFHDPVGLFRRLMKQRNPAAAFAIWSTGVSLAATPLDLLLQLSEHRLLKHAPPRKLPLVCICGPPRSGTTLVYQTLVQHLPVAYFSNLTATFPRSPLTATRIAQSYLSKPNASYSSFYGHTNHWSGTNDALNLWDRWLGANRSEVPESISPTLAAQMRRFFNGCEVVFERPLVCKNNSLNYSAHLVSEVLENVHFVCLTRDRQQLAESLYRARCDIHGDPTVPYGLFEEVSSSDPAASVCEQVLAYENLAATQRERIGPDRFWLLPYEDFCHRPDEIVKRLARKVLQLDLADLNPLPEPFQISQKQRVASEVKLAIQKCFTSLSDRSAKPAVQSSM